MAVYPHVQRHNCTLRGEGDTRPIAAVDQRQAGLDATHDDVDRIRAPVLDRFLEPVVPNPFERVPPGTLVQLAPGAVRNWNLEFGNPTDITLRGFRRNSFKVGEEITVTVTPVKSGAPVGRAKVITKADGTKL